MSENTYDVESHLQLLAKEHLDRAARRQVRLCLERARRWSWAPDETLLALSNAFCANHPGLVVLSDQNLVFFDEDAGGDVAWDLPANEHLTAEALDEPDVGDVLVTGHGEEHHLETVGDRAWALELAALINGEAVGGAEENEQTILCPVCDVDLQVIGDQAYCAIDRLVVSADVTQDSAHDLPFVHTDDLIRGKYLGGHPDFPAPVTGAQFTVIEDWVGMWDAGRGWSLIFKWDEISSIEVDSSSEVRSRVTVPRLLALGIFALAVPKKEGVSYVIVETSKGEAIFELRTDPTELRAKWGNQFTTKPKGLQTESDLSGSLDETSTPDVASRLRQLDELLQLKLISDDEHEELRTRILQDL